MNETQNVLLEIQRIGHLLEKHIDKTTLQIEDHAKVIKAHSEEIWGTGDANPGLKRKNEKIEGKIEKMQDLENDRKKWRFAIGGTTITIALERAYHLFFK